MKLFKDYLVVNVWAIIGLVCLTGYNVQAQKKIDYGLKFGLNLADLATSESKLSPRSTFHFGVEAEYRFKEDWSLTTELTYSRLGDVRRGFTEEDVKFDNVLALDYIVLPLMLNYYISNGFYVNAGPQLGFLINAAQSETIGFDSSRENVNDRYKTLDFSGVFSLGYLTDWGFNVGLRYQLGFINVLEQDLEYTSFQRHSAFQLYMSVRF